MIRKCLVALSLLGLGVCNGASAGDFYALGEVTHSSASLDRGYFDSALSSGGATGLASSDSGSSNQWRLQGGYRFSPYLSAEIGFIDFGKAKYRASYADGSARGTLKSSGLDAALLLWLPLDDDFSVFVKGGAVAARSKASLAAGAPADAAAGKSSTDAVRPLVGVGVSYRLGNHFSLRADIDYVNGLGKSGSTGRMDSTMVSLGLGYGF